jgi:uncharacterized membrane protein
MSDLVVITFDNAEEAGKVRETLKSGERSGLLRLDDSAVVVKDEEGKVHVKNEMDRGVAIGAVGGGVVGLLLASVFFPVAGIIVGAVLGGLVGKSVDLGVDQKFVKEVSEDLSPGTSAIFFIIRDGNADAVAATLRQYQGTVRQTSLPKEAEDELRRILKKKI